MSVKSGVRSLDLHLRVALNDHNVPVHRTETVVPDTPHGAPHDLAIGRAGLNDPAVAVNVTYSNDSAHTCFS